MLTDRALIRPRGVGPHRIETLSICGRDRGFRHDRRSVAQPCGAAVCSEHTLPLRNSEVNHDQ